MITLIARYRACILYSIRCGSAQTAPGVNAPNFARPQIDEYKALARDDEDSDLRESAQLEIIALEKQRESVEHSLLLSLLPHDDVDDRDIMLEVRAAAGGQEAALFAEELFGMYQAFSGEARALMLLHLSDARNEHALR